MIQFRINDMRFEYHSPNIVPFPEYVLDAYDVEEIKSVKEKGE